MRPEDLWRVVEDPAAAPDARAAAAILLRGEHDEERRTRLRVAADASASPKLRDALEAALGDAPLEETLAPFEEEEGDGGPLLPRHA